MVLGRREEPIASLNSPSCAPYWDSSRKKLYILESKRSDERFKRIAQRTENAAVQGGSASKASHKRGGWPHNVVKTSRGVVDTAAILSSDEFLDPPANHATSLPVVLTLIVTTLFTLR